MAQIPESEHSLSSTIYQALEKNAEPPRPHLGASVLGHPCDRWLWLSFRWAVIEKFSGRILRLFRRGQLEEDAVIADLESVGCRVSDRQRQVAFGSHVGGSIDGIIEGVPEAPAKQHLLKIS